MNTRLSWPLVALVVAIVGAVSTLLVMGKPVSELMDLAQFVLMAVLYGELQTVKTQTNGQTHRLMSIVEQTAIPSGQSTKDKAPESQA